MTVLYGIKNCDTIKKAKKWLDANNIDYQFHDYRVQGIEQEWLTDVVNILGWEIVLNKRGTTYRQLSQEIKDSLDKDTAIEQMLIAPAMIKRPILSTKEQFFIGFKDAEYQEIFG